jgi:hypothetical protein
MAKATFMICCINIVLTLVLPSAAVLKSGNRTVTNQRIEATKGSRITLHCEGGSNLDWKKRIGSTVTSLPTVGSGVFQTKSKVYTILTINSLTPARTGVYACHNGASIIETVTVGEFMYIMDKLSSLF